MRCATPHRNYTPSEKTHFFIINLLYSFVLINDKEFFIHFILIFLVLIIVLEVNLINIFLVLNL